MADTETLCSASKSTVGDNSDTPAQAGTDNCPRERRHFSQPRPANGTFGAQHNDIARSYQTIPYGVRTRLLRVETTRRTTVLHPGLVRDLGHCAVRGQGAL